MPETTACPDQDCDSTNINVRPVMDTRYRCNDCGNEFDEPNRREKKTSGGTSGLSRDLENTSPEDLGLSPMTD